MSDERCSFCRSSDDHTHLIAGQGGVFICHRCVKLAVEMLAPISCEQCKVARDRKPMTKGQARVFAFVAEFIRSNTYAPSFDEIARHLGYGSLATVYEHLSNLERKGWIRRRYNESRSIEIIAA